MKKILILVHIAFLVCTSLQAQESFPKMKLPLGKYFFTKPLVDSVSLKPYSDFAPNYNVLDNQAQFYKSVGLGYKPETNSSFINKPYTKFIIPTVLISYGVANRFSTPMKELDWSTDHEIGEHLSRGTWVDDYLQFAPAVAVYGLDMAGVKAKHNFKDRTLVMATSYLVMGATVQTMKSTIHVDRPSGGSTSFPSGHTATAFVGAHILFKEYQDTSPWIGVAGYTSATAVGTMRVFNHKHWVSDVVTGAGIGILSAEVGYMMLPVWHRVFGIKDKDTSMVIVPAVSTDNVGVGMSYTF